MTIPNRSLQEETLDAVVDTLAENTTTLIQVQQQAAATSASVKDARTYIARVAQNTDWEKNGKAIAAILEKAVREDRAALTASAQAARDMKALSGELTRKAAAAAEAQQDGSKAFHQAATRLLGVMEAHREGRWRRMGAMALIAALCGAVGFFLGDPGSRIYYLVETKLALERDVTHRSCDTLGGENLLIDGDRACVIKENPG